MNITREFGLYCDKEFYRSLFESSPFVGAIFGMLIFAYTSDNYGRKITILLSWFLASIGYFLLYFATSTWQLIIFNALVGAGIWPALIYNFVYVSEIFSLTYRKLSTGFLFLGSSMFGVVLAALAYYFDNWRYLVLTGAVPMLLLNFLSFYLVETPNFYSSRNLEKTV
mmetsp:Transcript_105674/g.158192  ORF Transcript_105674/g.158192 Transcript_105674/m.158192 type:complete len:168 (-) Transcript_105674:171-674(-)